jgi:DNA-binding MarR family transcriptional regulator
VAQKRILAVVRTPQIHRDLGSALLLLIRILELCGPGNTCENSLTQIAADLGIPVPTLKKWSGILEARGIILKQKCGHGIRIQVNPDSLPPIESHQPDDGAISARKILEGLKTTIEATLEGAIQRLPAKSAAVGGAA